MKKNKNKSNSTHYGGCGHSFSKFDKELSVKPYKVHGNIVFVPFDRKRPRLDAWFTCVCTQCVNLSVLLLSLSVLSWGNVNLVWFDCAYSCAHHNCVTNITCACLCCTCFFKCKKYSLSLFCCLICCKLSELSCTDLLWMWVTPQYLLRSQLMALKHVEGIHCNATPVMNKVYTRVQEPQICSSVLRSQPVFHLLLEALKRGWNLDHLDIPVAWMFSLQRTSIPCSSLTLTYFTSSPLAHHSLMRFWLHSDLYRCEILVAAAEALPFIVASSDVVD